MPDSPLTSIIGPNPNYGKIASRSERNRQNIIDLGLNQINSVFGGGTAPFYSLANANNAAFDPHGTYYSLGAHGFSPYWSPGVRPQGHTSSTVAGVLAGSGHGSGTVHAVKSALGVSDFINSIFGKTDSPAQVADKQFRRGLLFDPANYQTFEGFQPDFYQKRAQAYTNYALPQVAQQYQTNRNSLLYGLSNRGLSNSSVAGHASAELERTANTARQTVADTGLEQANQLKRDVESARQQSVSQLYQTADPGQATQQAISSAASLRQPSTFAPIANMFSGLANQFYINQALNNFRQPTYGLGMGTNQGTSLAGALGPLTYKS